MATKSSCSHTSEIIRTGIAGAAFGSALTIAQVYLPDVIINQMRMRDFHMLEVFLTATGFSAIVFILRKKFSQAKPITRANSRLSICSKNISSYDGNILGGALIGLGMATSGACPGTVIIQLAQGITSAKITFLGAMIGGTAWALFGDRIVHCHDTSSDSKVASMDMSRSQSAVERSTPDVGDGSKEARAPSLDQTLTPGVPIQFHANDNDKMSHTTRFTISEALNTNPTKTLFTFLFLTSSTVLFSRFWLPGKTYAKTSTIVSGTLIAVAQAVSLVMTNTPLGTSKAYEEIGGFIAQPFRTILQRPLGTEKRTKELQSATKLTPTPTSILKIKNVIFALGMALGSRAISSTSIGGGGRSSSALAMLTPAQVQTQTQIPSLQALLGGVFLSFGARMAGGCTSGHGISGLSSLSFASLISVLNMFGAGIGTRLAMDLAGL